MQIVAIQDNPVKRHCSTCDVATSTYAMYKQFPSMPRWKYKCMMCVVQATVTASYASGIYN